MDRLENYEAHRFEDGRLRSHMETLNDLNKLKFYGERRATSSNRGSDGPTVAFLRPRLHVLYETSADDLPDSFRELLTLVSQTFDDR